MISNKCHFIHGTFSTSGLSLNLAVIDIMNEKWRNRLLYWTLTMVPLSGLWIIGEFLGYGALTLYLMFYIFLYRPLIDTQRLISLNKIQEKDAWRFFVPLQVDSTRYFRNLWFD